IHAVTGVCQNDYGSVREPANFHGACHLVHRAVWEGVGELDSRCSFGGEELDYAIRARAAGFATLYAAHVTVRHNSMLRTAALDRSRRERWVFNYVRIICKHFPLPRALLYSVRNVCAHLLSAVTTHGMTAAPALLASALRGARAGRLTYSPLPGPTARFYANSRLLPDFG